MLDPVTVGPIFALVATYTTASASLRLGAVCFVG